MKTGQRLLLGLGLGLAFVGGASAADFGTAFTYQGALVKAGMPVTELCDFDFSLWDAASGPNQIGSTLMFVDTQVTDGQFKAALDFGAGAFSGHARYLEIVVECVSDTEPVTLSPRVELTPSPHAIRALEGVGPPNALEVDTTTGRVGIGTTDPQHKLHVSGQGQVLALEGTGHSFIGWYPHGFAAGRKGWMGWDVNEAVDLTIRNEINGADILLRPSGTGNVGIGTTDPQTNLHVSGQGQVLTLEGTGHSFIAWYRSAFANGRSGWMGWGNDGDVDLTIRNEINGADILLRPSGTGNVGIGTTAPESELHVAGDTGTTTLRVDAPDGEKARLLLLSGADVGALFLDSFDNLVLNNTVTGGELSLNTESTQRLRILANGNVLIGIGASGDSSVQLPPGAIGLSELDTDSVGSAKIIDGTIKAADIGSLQIFTGHINDLAVGTAKIQSGAVTTFNIASGAVTTDKIANASVGTFKIIDGTITGADIQQPLKLGGTEVNLASGGHLIIGATSGLNLAMDGDELQSRNNGAASKFIINPAGGNVGIGTTTPQTPLHVSGGVDANLNSGGYFLIGAKMGLNLVMDDNEIMARNNGGRSDLLLNNEGGNIKAFAAGLGGRFGMGRTPASNRLEVQGSASQSVSAFWLINSDRRIKQDIETIEGPLETLDKVRLVSFRYTEEYRAAHPSIDDHRYLNIIAQEFAQVFPNYVKGSGEKLDNSDEEILQVDTYPLIIYAAAAIQELHGIVKDRDGRILALEARLGELESAMGTSGPSSRASTLGVGTPALALVALFGLVTLGRSRKGGTR